MRIACPSCGAGLHVSPGPSEHTEACPECGCSIPIPAARRPRPRPAATRVPPKSATKPSRSPVAKAPASGSPLGVNFGSSSSPMARYRRRSSNASVYVGLGGLLLGIGGVAVLFVLATNKSEKPSSDEIASREPPPSISIAERPARDRREKLKRKASRETPKAQPSKPIPKPNPIRWPQVPTPMAPASVEFKSATILGFKPKAMSSLLGGSVRFEAKPGNQLILASFDASGAESITPEDYCLVTSAGTVHFPLAISFGREISLLQLSDHFVTETITLEPGEQAARLFANRPGGAKMVGGVLDEAFVNLLYETPKSGKLAFAHGEQRTEFEPQRMAQLRPNR